MCQPLPGPRCSQHAREKFVAADGRLTALRGQRAAALAVGDDAEAASVEARLFDAGMDVEEARREYDATPDGLTDLRGRLERAVSNTDRAELDRRLQGGEDRYEQAREALAQVELRRRVLQAHRALVTDRRLRPDDGSDPNERFKDLARQATADPNLAAPDGTVEDLDAYTSGPVHPDRVAAYALHTMSAEKSAAMDVRSAEHDKVSAAETAHIRQVSQAALEHAHMTAAKVVQPGDTMTYEVEDTDYGRLKTVTGTVEARVGDDEMAVRRADGTPDQLPVTSHPLVKAENDRYLAANLKPRTPLPDGYRPATCRGDHRPPWLGAAALRKETDRVQLKSAAVRKSGPLPATLSTSGGQLNDRAKTILSVAGKRYPSSHARERAISEQTGLSSTAFQQNLNAIIDHDQAEVYSPSVVRALRAQRDKRSAYRSPQGLASSRP